MKIEKPDVLIGNIQETQEALMKKLDDVELAIQQAEMKGWRKGNELKQKRLDIKLQQAQQEVAREIFEWLDNHRYLATFDAWQTKCWGISDSDLEDGKSQYLEEKK
jgi:hypothetical protein